MFIARNVSLGARKAEKTKASGKAAAEEETAVEEEVAAPELGRRVGEARERIVFFVIC